MVHGQKLARIILNPFGDWKRIRKAICYLHYENYTFNVTEASILAPRLLQLAVDNCSSIEDWENGAIGCAIRLGAAMLPISRVSLLLPLLNSSFPIDERIETIKINTKIETVKMIGRIFEAQQPGQESQYSSIAEKINTIIDEHLVKIEESPKDAAVVSLSIYAIAAMRDRKELLSAIEKIVNANCNWFMDIVEHDFEDLIKYWEDNDCELVKEAKNTIQDAIQKLN